MKTLLTLALAWVLWSHTNDPWTLPGSGWTAVSVHDSTAACQTARATRQSAWSTGITVERTGPGYVAGTLTYGVNPTRTARVLWLWKCEALP